jgi:hypothetical protein
MGGCASRCHTGPSRIVENERAEAAVGLTTSFLRSPCEAGFNKARGSRRHGPNPNEIDGGDEDACTCRVWPPRLDRDIAERTNNRDGTHIVVGFVCLPLTTLGGNHQRWPISRSVFAILQFAKSFGLLGADELSTHPLCQHEWLSRKWLLSIQIKKGFRLRPAF